MKILYPNNLQGRNFQNAPMFILSRNMQKDVSIIIKSLVTIDYSSHINLNIKPKGQNMEKDKQPENQEHTLPYSYKSYNRNSGLEQYRSFYWNKRQSKNANRLGAMEAYTF
uniref:Uncharacterized protein n=1 Tax=Cacopsylla melanoneura TaxID=428564 RepID=A0A8D8RI27_9HEMI